MHSFPKAGAKSCEKGNLVDEGILYNSTELSVDCTFRYFQNQTMLFPIKMETLI